MKRKWKFLVAGLVVVSALGYLGYRGYVSSAAYYLEVDELLAQATAMVDENVRLGGVVQPGSIVQSGRNLRFLVSHDEHSIPVVYEGIVPDAFKAGGEVIVDGKLNEAGTFVGTVLTAKCPSKYVPE